MCDYCDCRSHPQIASLSADHERLQSLLTEIAGAADGHDRERCRSLAGRLRRILDPHADREERGVFAQLRAAGVDDDYVARFEDEHVLVHALVAGLASDEWLSEARRLVEVLRGHIAREETDLFPAAHQLLHPAQWDVIDAEVGSAPASRWARPGGHVLACTDTRTGP
jgi:hemerythrin-like domain-containing protein